MACGHFSDIGSAAAGGARESDTLSGPRSANVVFICVKNIAIRFNLLQV